MTLQTLPSLPDDLSNVLAAAKALANWNIARLDGLAIANNDRTRVPGALFDLTLEHHIGIVHLVDARIYGPAFALLRASFETLVRGAWLQLCATDDELKSFVEDDKLPRNLKFGDLVKAIEGHADFADKALSQLKHNSWGAMNGYTHGGMLQIGRRFSNNAIQPKYDSGEVIEVLKASGTFALIALLQIARLAKNNALEQEVNTRLTQGVAS